MDDAAKLAHDLTKDEGAKRENFKDIRSHLMQDLSQKQIFKGAMGILIALGFLFFCTLCAYTVHPKDGAELIDVCKTVFPPIVMLILVFYFGK